LGRWTRIKIHQTGVCGTDLHLHHGTYIGVYPLTPGHERIGEVDEVGSEVTRFRRGERATVNPNIYCGHLPYCLAGQLVRCAISGGQCSWTPIDAKRCWKSESRAGEFRTARGLVRLSRQYAASTPAASPTFHSTG
jgi:threonine dehydrogenase-like Zn-dependent dehydrogenase